MKNSKASILIVEDDPAILSGLVDVLVFNGYAPVGCADGGEGLARAMDLRATQKVLYCQAVGYPA